MHTEARHVLIQNTGDTEIEKKEKKERNNIERTMDMRRIHPII